MDDFLNKRLLQPLHFHEFAWSHCPKNYPMGATGLYVSAGDVIKLPVLYLNGGVWEGKRLLSEQWVERSIANEYEFRLKTPSGWIGKGGMYGQLIAFNRARNAAVAWLGHTRNGDAIQNLINLIDKTVK